MNFKDKKTKNFMIGIVGALLLTACCVIAVQANTEDMYSIYELNGQHIGTIEDHKGNIHEDCLIFDVNCISYNGDLFFSETKIKEFVSDIKYLYTCGSDEGPLSLYFAKEDVRRADLEDGDYIVIKWERIGTGGYWIRGVWAWDDFLNKEC